MNIGTVFTTIGLLAISGGGLLAAFCASRPTTFKVWLSAYLVLVAGLLQIGLATSWQQLGEPQPGLAITAFTAYNLGNLLVIYGTARKWQKQSYKNLVNSGGGFLLLAMILLIFATASANASWALARLWLLMLVILVSMPIGLYLSANRRKQNQVPKR